MGCSRTIYTSAAWLVQQALLSVGLRDRSKSSRKRLHGGAKTGGLSGPIAISRCQSLHIFERFHFQILFHLMGAHSLWRSERCQWAMIRSPGRIQFQLNPKTISCSRYRTNVELISRGIRVSFRRTLGPIAGHRCWGRLNDFLHLASRRGGLTEVCRQSLGQGQSIYWRIQECMKHWWKCARAPDRFGSTLLGESTKSSSRAGPPFIWVRPALASDNVPPLASTFWWIPNLQSNSLHRLYWRH